MKIFTRRRKRTAPIEYGAVSYWLTVLMIVLSVVIVVAVGALGLMYRADARVALGNAKTVRLALQTASIETYADELAFVDPTKTGGVTEKVRTEVYTRSKAPGDFQVIKVDESQYEVLEFTYTEGDFVVHYTAEPVAWTVNYQFNLLDAQA